MSLLVVLFALGMPIFSFGVFVGWALHKLAVDLAEYEEIEAERQAEESKIVPFPERPGA